ncbi:MAG: DNA primase [Desulfovibrio sp. S3730MH75]|nr:MAG: DNA primase [Desulfovibrio sp. S3730MH75]
MKGRIPQAFLDEVLARTDLVELIDSRVPLKKSGHNYSACCPFHNEKTPSFNVNQDKQFFHCFGCGISGNAISFLMEYDRLEFLDAVDDLASTLGMEIPREAGTSEVPISSDLYDLMAEASLYYQQLLKTKADDGKAINYLQKRGLSGEVARDFGLGYASDKWDGLLKSLGGSSERQQKLVDTGMLIKKDNGNCYDRFRDRVMFPIRDRRGKVIAFGGRIIDQGEPKYLNSPETPIFHKGRELYGLFEARQANRKLQNILIVEGYMDVVALAQFDIRNTVATLGTATNEFHLQQLFKVVNELVFCFDGDKAGLAAAWKALEIALPLIRGDRLVRFMFLPDGEDPDTMVRKIGKEAFVEQQNQAVSLSQFMFEHLAEGSDLSTPDGRSSYVARVKKLLEKVTDPILKELLITELGERVHLSSERLAQAMNIEKTSATGSNKRVSSKPKSITPMRMVIGLLVQNPKLAKQVSDYQWLEHVSQPGAPLLKAMLEMLHQNPHLTTGALIEHWRGSDEHRQLMTLAIWEHLIIEKDTIITIFCDAIEKLFTEIRHNRLSELISRQKQHLLSENEKLELKQLLSGSL